MRTSTETTVIDAAMAAIQAAIEPITKDKIIKVEGTGGGWSSGFATLPLLYGTVRPLLSQHKIAIYQGTRFVEGGGGWALVTRLTLDGEWIETDYPVKQSKDGAQGFGGGNSFARRWAICGLFGLVPQDAEEGAGYKDARAASRPARRPPVPAGIAATVEAIRVCDTIETLIATASRARSDHPVGEASAAVERAIEGWFVSAFNVAEINADDVSALRAAATSVKPRGSSVRDAIQRAAQRTSRQPEKP